MTEADVTDFLDRYAAAWAANDPDAIAAHWDAGETAPFYKAEEVDHYFHEMAEIVAYWRHNQAFHRAIRLRFGTPVLTPLPGGLSMAVFAMRWDIRFADTAQLPDGSTFSSAGKRMGGDNHVLALLRETPNGIRLGGWSETPDAPIAYVRRLYEQNADPAIGA